jgi:hypothetical protein
MDLGFVSAGQARSRSHQNFKDLPVQYQCAQLDALLPKSTCFSSRNPVRQFTAKIWISKKDSRGPGFLFCCHLLRQKKKAGGIKNEWEKIAEKESKQ